MERHGEIESISNGIGLQEASTDEHEPETNKALTVSAPPMAKLFNDHIEMDDVLP